jgi:hypothetical protein
MAPGVASVAEYLASLPPERRAAITRVRSAIRARLPAGYEETLQFGMISWVVPASRLSHTYNGQPLPLASLGSQKHHMALYLMCVYGDATLRAWFEDAFRAAGKRLDMGKSCVRFQSSDDLPLDVIAEAIARVPVDQYIAWYEANRPHTVKPKPVATGSTKPTRVAAKPTRVAAKATRTKPTRVAAKPTRAKPARVAAKPTRVAAKATRTKPTRVAAKPTRAKPAPPLR